MPLLPSLTGFEICYSLLTVFQILATHITLVDANTHRRFIGYICLYLQNIKRAEFNTNILQMISKWLVAEEEILTVKDIEDILRSLKEIHNLFDTIIYIQATTEYWNFIYALCVRYVVFVRLVKNSLNILSRIVLFTIRCQPVFSRE